MFLSLLAGSEVTAGSVLTGFEDTISFRWNFLLLLKLLPVVSATENAL